MKNVSQPVIEIVRLLQAAPDRFSFTLTANTYATYIVVADATMNKEFYLHHEAGHPAAAGLTWLTEEESSYLGSAADAAYRRRMECIKNKDRDEWTKAYLGVR